MIEALLSVTETTAMLVITKVDAMTVSDKELEKASQSSGDKEIKRKELIKKRIDQTTYDTASKIKMANVWERTKQLSCYSDATAGDENHKITRNHDIDRDMCELWEKILQPQYYKQFQKKE